MAADAGPKPSVGYKHKLTHEECLEIIRRIQMVQSYKETWEIIDNPEPKIVIAGSGMVTGGRVLSYLKMCLKMPETTVLLDGYRVEGTRDVTFSMAHLKSNSLARCIPLKPKSNYLKFFPATPKGMNLFHGCQI